MSATEILIAKYEQSVAQELKAQLEKLGYKVADIADSGDAAAKRTQILQPDLVLMNVRLNGAIDGIQIGSYIREYHDTLIVYAVNMATFDVLNHLMVGIAVWLARGENFRKSGVFDFFPLMLDLTLLLLNPPVFIELTLLCINKYNRAGNSSLI